MSGQFWTQQKVMDSLKLTIFYPVLDDLIFFLEFFDDHHGKEIQGTEEDDEMEALYQVDMRLQTCIDIKCLRNLS